MKALDKLTDDNLSLVEFTTNLVRDGKSELEQLYSESDDLARIEKLLDKHVIDSVRGASVVDRVNFALELLDERTDQIVNSQHGE